MLTQGLMKYLVDVRRGLLHNGSRQEGGKTLTEGLRSRDLRRYAGSYVALLNEVPNKDIQAQDMGRSLL